MSDPTSREALQEERHLRSQRAEAAKAAPLLAEGGFEAMQNLPRRMGGLARMEALLARSWELRHENHALMIQFASAAVFCAQQLNVRKYGLQRVFDFQCRAHAELGNAFRVSDQLPRAARLLAHARQLFEQGTGDEVLEIRLVELEASLAVDRRQFGLACNNLDKVLRFHRRTGDRHLAGRTIILQGLYTGYAGDPEKGFQLLGEGLALLDEARDPAVAYAAVHNQLLSLIDSGLFDEARKFRVRHSRQLANHWGRVNEIRFRGLEGRIDAGRNKHARAEATFREVKQGFEEAERTYDAAIISLDLAACLLAQGKAGESEEVVREAAKVFSALRIEREALAAVIMLRQAFEARKATVAMVEEVAAFLRRAEHDPHARFNPRRW